MNRLLHCAAIKGSFGRRDGVRQCQLLLLHMGLLLNPLLEKLDKASKGYDSGDITTNDVAALVENVYFETADILTAYVPKISFQNVGNPFINSGGTKKSNF